MPVGAGHDLAAVRRVPIFPEMTEGCRRGLRPL